MQHFRRRVMILHNMKNLCAGHATTTRGVTRYTARRNAFTLIEMLIVISIIAILASLMFPSLKNARDMAYRTSCLNTQLQIGTAFSLYLDENNNFFPSITISTAIIPNGGMDWRRALANPYMGYTQTGWVLQDQVKKGKEFYCENGFEYFTGKGGSQIEKALMGMNSNDSGKLRPNMRPKASKACLVADASLNIGATQTTINAHVNQNNPPEMVHSGGANILFFDYHAEWRSEMNIPTNTFPANERTLFWLGR